MAIFHYSDEFACERLVYCALEEYTRESQLRAANLIIIGASAGGHQALVEIFKSLSADMPTAIVILLHMPLESQHGLKEPLGRFSYQ
jgi:chemotaxis response regulator CheB